MTCLLPSTTGIAKENRSAASEVQHGRATLAFLRHETRSRPLMLRLRGARAQLEPSAHGYGDNMKITILDDYQNVVRTLDAFKKLEGHEVTIWNDHTKDVDVLADRLKDTEAL